MRVSPDSGMWAHCSCQWVSRDGNANLFKQSCIKMVLKKKKKKFCLFSAPALWRKLLPGSLLLLLEAPCLWLAAFLQLLGFLPSAPLNTHAVLFPSDFPSLFPFSQTFWIFTYKQIPAESIHAWVFRTFSIREANFTFLKILLSEVWFSSSVPCSCNT